MQRVVQKCNNQKMKHIKLHAHQMEYKLNVKTISKSFMKEFQRPQIQTHKNRMKNAFCQSDWLHEI